MYLVGFLPISPFCVSLVCDDSYDDHTPVPNDETTTHRPDPTHLHFELEENYIWSFFALLLAFSHGSPS